MADELERALLLRDLELMGQPRNPNAVQPGRAGLLDLGVGLPERLAFLNQTFNPVEAIGQSMNAGGRMMSPNMGVMDRLAALGDMASGIAGVVAPVAAAARAGTPSATALMEGLLGGSPTQQAASDMARGFVTDESGALRLFHGSPHDFDRFSMSKIGTGEGAQAYGHGLYFAENEGVARGYRDALVDARIPALNDRLRELAREIENISSGYRQWKPGTEEAGKALSTEYDALMDARSKMKGRMYEVNVNANPEDFINFDAPFEQQPPNVQKHFAYLARGENKPTGEDLARRMESNIYIREAAEAGVPGIRYLDEGSRNQALAPYYNVVRESDGAIVQQKIDRGSRPEVSEGFRVEGPIDTRTRNYVVFDENLINIVRKYGIAGAAAMLGVSALDVEQAMAQGQQRPQGLLSTGVQ